MTPAPRRWFRWSAPLASGALGVLAWLGILCAAFIQYPKPDNLVVSYPVWALLGLPGVERLISSPLVFVMVIFVEGLFVFAVFGGVGFVIRRMINGPSDSSTH